MLVCHIWNIFFPLGVGGVKQDILRLSNYLSRENYDVHFLVLTEHVLGLSKYEKYESLNIYRLGFNLPDFISRGRARRLGVGHMHTQPRI